MNFKILVSLVIAALMFVGTATTIPVAPDNAAPAIDQPISTEPAGTVAKPVADSSDIAVAVTELTADEATAIALLHAGLSDVAPEAIRAERDLENGAPEFEIEFRDGDYEYDYTVDAVTGEILEQDKEYDPPKATPVETAPAETLPVETVPPATEPAPVELTKEEAAAIALKDAGLKKDDVSWLKTKRENDDGVPEWDVEFRSGDYEYDYTVHAFTGDILDRDKEYDPPEVAPVETAPVETAPVETVPVELTKEEAVAIALEDAGLTVADVTELKAKRDSDDGIPEFDIEFRGGDYEYDYTVHALTGEILERDKELDPIEVAPVETTPVETVPATLTREAAVAIALEHATLTAEEVTRLEAELDEDDGKLEWEVEFRKGNVEYSYTIHGETGKILDWEKEIDD